MQSRLGSAYLQLDNAYNSLQGLNMQAHGCASRSDKPQHRLALVSPSFAHCVVVRSCQPAMHLL
jgi:hypothetical protein